jgi:hypothetical protein
MAKPKAEVDKADVALMYEQHNRVFTRIINVLEGEDVEPPEALLVLAHCLANEVY